MIKDNDIKNLTAEEFIKKHQKLCLEKYHYNYRDSFCESCRMRGKCFIQHGSLINANPKEYISILLSDDEVCKKCGFVFNSSDERRSYKFCPSCGEKNVFHK